jgi:hypothetical protein
LDLLTTTDRRVTDDKHVTVPDAVTFGARSDISMITGTGSDYTGDNRSKFILREDKQLLNCIETVRVIVGKGTVTELCRERVRFIVRKGSVTELCRESKVYCEKGNSY